MTIKKQNNNSKLKDMWFYLLARIFFTSAIVLFFINTGYGQLESKGAEKTLLILHTNDIHDHLRPDYDGIGGLPFISGFVNKVRSQRNDLLVLDAGDITGKGDLVARKTRGENTFEALSRIGYHAWVPGNHDYDDFGIEALHRFSVMAGMDILCLNLFKEDGSLEFKPSKIYEINGIRVGVLGAIVPRREFSLDLGETALAMSRESKRLKTETDIIIALVHLSSRDAAYISEIAPDIDIFITGHSHETLHEPIEVPKSGSLIVQAGSNANYVGCIELTLDILNRRIISYDYKLTEMNHATISPDLEMIEWVRQIELQLVPEAQMILGWSPREITYIEVGILAAEALRMATGADVSFNNTQHIVRSTLPMGILDLNSIYRTGGERGNQLIEVELLGSEINSYLLGLHIRGIQTQWSGFYGFMEEGMIKSDLDPDIFYRVVMPEREWRERFLELFEKVAENPKDWPCLTKLNRSINPKLLELSWTDAMIQLLDELKQKGIGLLDKLQNIILETGPQVGIKL